MEARQDFWLPFQQQCEKGGQILVEKETVIRLFIMQFI